MPADIVENPQKMELNACTLNCENVVTVVTLI